MPSGVNIPIKLVDQISTDLDHIRNKLDVFGKASTQLKIGFAAGAGAAAFRAVQGAADDVIRVMGEMVTKAMEEEVSIGKLDAALRANVRGYDGNRDAIESVIREREKLAFSDDEQRSSLAILVARTKDYGRALDIQRDAMDLARLKGIDLETATRGISMALSGNGRMLKELGINVKDYTTAEEALTEVRKRAAGQAEAYGKTTKGTMESLQITLDDLQEDIGTQLLPVVTELARTFRDDVIPSVRNLTDDIGPAADAFGFLAGAINLNLNPAQAIKDMMDRDIAAALDKQTAKLAEGAGAWDTFSEKNAAAREPTMAAAGTIRDAGDEVQTFTDRLKKAGEAWDTLNAKFAADNEFANLPDKITLAADEVKTANRELGNALESGDEVAIASARIRLRNAEASLAELRREWARLRVEMSRGVRVGDVYTPPWSGNPQPRAAGGPVVGGRPYIVGESGPELFVPGQSGGIIPGGGGSSVTVNVAYSPGLSTASPAEMDAAARVLGPAIVRELRSRGLIAAGSY